MREKVKIKRHRYKYILLIFIIVIITTTMGIFSFLNKNKVKEVTNADYGNVIPYKIGQEIHFPDFNIKFMGTRKIPGPNNAKWSSTYYDFEIKDKNETKNIIWSSGAGEIAAQEFTIKAPPEFNVNELIFYLELKYSIKEGKLKDNELVILSNKQFLEKK